MNGFGTFVRQGLRVVGAPVTVNAKLAIADQKTEVNVTANPNGVSVDPDNNASTIVLTGKDLDALSDDPDELSSELTALAGPSAGPNGGQIYIDGFTGGQLPPKSSIREIRINQNPFSAQYDKVGYGRIEIFTKPGTDKFHGFQTNYPGQGLRSEHRLARSWTVPRHSRSTTRCSASRAIVSGPDQQEGVVHGCDASYRRSIQNNSLIVNPTGYLRDSARHVHGTPARPGQAGCSVYATTAGIRLRLYGSCRSGDYASGMFTARASTWRWATRTPSTDPVLSTTHSSQTSQEQGHRPPWTCPRPAIRRWLDGERPIQISRHARSCQLQGRSTKFTLNISVPSRRLFKLRHSTGCRSVSVQGCVQRRRLELRRRRTIPQARTSSSRTTPPSRSRITLSASAAACAPPASC